jgi:spore germination protein KC
MKKIRITLLILIILINVMLTTGCWNYKEIDDQAIVAGLAVDKGITEKFKLTVEIIKISGIKDIKLISETITAEGRTMFDAVRNIISVSGKKLYWSHAKVMILSKEIASEGVIRVIEWYTRDSETREDVNILISEEASAQEIFSGQKTIEDIKSFTLGQVIKNQSALSKTPDTDILEFCIESRIKGNSIMLPSVKLTKIDGKVVPEIMGAAIINKDKLVGFLTGDETKELLFIRNEIKGGLLVEEIRANNTITPVSLEIFKSKTKVSPVINGKNIEMNIDIDTTVAIDEIEGTENFVEDEGHKKLEQLTEKAFQEQVNAFIKKIQSEYDADIFGFALKLQEEKSKVWKNVSNDWEDIFKGLKVNVKTKVHIKNSSMLSKTLGESE